MLSPNSRPKTRLMLSSAGPHLGLSVRRGWRLDSGAAGLTCRPTVVRWCAMPKVLIPDKLRRGLLPITKPVKLWVGLGNGRPCDGCGRSITAHELEDEFEYSDGSVMRMHRGCSSIWRDATGN